VTEPICERTLDDYEAGHLTGFTRRAAAALIHLADAWNQADGSNTPGVVLAIWHLQNCRSLASNGFAYDQLLLLTLGEYGGQKLIAELRALTAAQLASLATTDLV